MAHTEQDDFKSVAIAAICTIGPMTALAVYLTYPFFTVPIGTSGRPMGFMMIWLPISAVSVVLGTAASIGTFSKGFGWAVAFFLLGFLPFAVGMLAIQYAIRFRGYEMLP